MCPALSYNAINSSIDGIRGKHDAFGSMAAGGLTGALYKSTGTPSFFWLLFKSDARVFHSWCSTCSSCSYDYDWPRRRMELCQKGSMILYLESIYPHALYIILISLLRYALLC